MTPHWQLIHAMLSDKGDKTKISLIDWCAEISLFTETMLRRISFSNKTYEDILLRDELGKYAEKQPDRFKLWHVVSKAPKDAAWKYGEGSLDQKLM